MAHRIYCISGLGADEQAFSRLHIKNHELKFLPWLKPMKNETISTYAGRMAELISEPSPLIIGLSFGGMIAIEIAKQMAVEKIILISSVKTKYELPGWMRITGRLKLHKILPVKSNRFTERFDNAQLGASTQEERAMVKAYRQNADLRHVAWGIDQVLNWRNIFSDTKIFHIHGEYDRVFPVKNVKPTHLIKQATHIMVFNRASEISDCINQILTE